jgi:hypothetical protein
MGLKWKLVSVHLEIELTLTQDRCTVCTNITLAQKLFWTHPMDLLGDVGHVKPHFGLFGDYVSVGARYVQGLCRMYHRLRNHFGHTRWNSYMTWVMFNLVLFYVGDIVCVGAR